MGHVLRRKKTVASLEHSPLVSDARLEPTGSDVCHLPVGVMMNRADRPFVKIDAYDHDVVAVRQNLPTHPLPRRGPRTIGAYRKCRAPTHHGKSPFARFNRGSDQEWWGEWDDHVEVVNHSGASVLDVDAATAGAWAGARALKATYQLTDEQTLLAVVTEPTELRDAGAVEVKQTEGA